MEEAGKYVSSDRQLGRGARLVLVCHTLFLLGMSLSGIYVNIFLFQSGDSIAPIGWYHLYQYVSLAIGFLVAGYWTERTDRTVTLRIGIILHAAFFLLILVLGTRAVHSVGQLGLLMGLGGGFYWLGNHTLTFDVTNDANRDYFNGLFWTWTSVATMVAPFIAGAIIVRMPGTAGYRIVFGLSLGLLLASVVVSLFVRHKPSDGVFDLLSVIKRKANPKWRDAMWIHGVNGVRNGVYMFLVGLLLFIATKNEFAVGSVALAGGIITLVMSSIIGARVQPATRWRPLTVGYFGLFIAVTVLATNMTPGGIILFSLIEAAFGPMYHIPFGALVYRTIDLDPKADDLRVEYMVAREISLNIGRVVGVGILIALVPHLTYGNMVLRVFVAGIGLIPVLGWRSHRRLMSE